MATLLVASGCTGVGHQFEVRSNKPNFVEDAGRIDQIISSVAKDNGLATDEYGSATDVKFQSYVARSKNDDTTSIGGRRQTSDSRIFVYTSRSPLDDNDDNRDLFDRLNANVRNQLIDMFGSSAVRETSRLFGESP